MRLRSRMVEDAGGDGRPIASVSSSSMDENSSVDAVVGSPSTRRSWSTLDSQNQPSSPTQLASDFQRPNSHNTTLYDTQPLHGGYNAYLTHDETTTQAGQNEYATEISDSQELIATSQVPTQSSEEQNTYVQRQSSSSPHTSQLYDDPYLDENPQTPARFQPQRQHDGYQNALMTPISPATVSQNVGSHVAHNQYVDFDGRLMTPHSLTPTQPQYHNHQPLYIQTPSHNAEYQHATTTPLMSPFQFTPTAHLTQPNSYNPFTRPLNVQIPASVPLPHFTTTTNQGEPWSPVRGSRKRGHSEVDSTLEPQDKLGKELNDMESQPKKRKRWTRGRPKAKRGSSSKDRGNRKDKSGGRGGGGAGGQGLMT